MYNVEPFIRECLDSCLHQSVPPNQYEIICVDDGSTDNTLTIVHEYECQNNNLSVVSLSDNKGVSTARNIGIDIAKGNYLWFVDGDDYIENGFLPVLFRFLQKHDVNCVEFCALEFKDNLSQNGRVFNEMIYTNNILFLKVFDKNTVLVNNIRFDENLCYGEDQLFSFTFSVCCKQTEHIDMVGYYYRRDNLVSAMNNINLSVYTECMIKSCKRTMRLAKTFEAHNDMTRALNSYVFAVSRINCAIDRIAYSSLIKHQKNIKKLRDNNLIPLDVPPEYKDKISNYYKCTMTYYRKICRQSFLEESKEKIARRISHPIEIMKHLFERFV